VEYRKPIEYGKDSVKAILKPSIPLDELSVSDDSNVTTENVIYKSSKSTTGAADKVGSDKPLIKINGALFTDIEYLCIDETGRIPKIKVIFTDSTGSLTGPNYPKNNPVMSVYIKTQNSKFKPIRCDFFITNIRSTKTDDLISDFIMSGELFIPKIYNNVSKSYPNMTSTVALVEVAKDNNLGFAENSFSAKDTMTWINTNKNSLDFIDDIGKHAYSNDNSFFNVFIDKYYHLNVVEVTQQLDPSHEVNWTYTNTSHSAMLNRSKEFTDLTGSKLEDQQTLLFLTNDENFQGKPEYIQAYGLSGDIGSILKNKGFKRKIYYYDHMETSKKDVSWFIKPIMIKGYKSDAIPMVPENESLRNNVIKKWMNIDYGNTHSEWNTAEVINDHNISELNKVKLIAKTDGINFQVIRGTGITVSIYLDSGVRSKQQSYRKVSDVLEEDAIISESSRSIDDIVSGKYYVNGVKYFFDNNKEVNKYYTEFQLARVNWLPENNMRLDAT
tara:strand:- start:3630 stop:5126 length:1497 start_codon:yes stop_codon:yes gene_type:complete